MIDVILGGDQTGSNSRYQRLSAVPPGPAMPRAINGRIGETRCTTPLLRISRIPSALGLAGDVEYKPAVAASVVLKTRESTCPFADMPRQRESLNGD